jgi:hypothetical protein
VFAFLLRKSSGRLGVDRLSGEMGQADMFNGNLDADPSELPGATALSSHVEAACLQHILPAPALFRTQQYTALSNRERHRRSRPIESGSPYYCSLCVAGGRLTSGAAGVVT